MPYVPEVRRAWLWLALRRGVVEVDAVAERLGATRRQVIADLRLALREPFLAAGVQANAAASLELASRN